MLFGLWLDSQDSALSTVQKANADAENNIKKGGLNEVVNVQRLGKEIRQMASYRDPQISFTPIEVVERLLEICECCGQVGRLYLCSSLDLATYLDSFGFDGYSLTMNTETAFEIDRATTMVLPSGDKSRNHFLAH